MELKQRTLHRNATIAEYEGITVQEETSGKSVVSGKKNKGVVYGLIASAGAIILICLICFRGGSNQVDQSATESGTSAPMITEAPLSESSTSEETETSAAENETTVSTATPTPTPTWEPQTGAIASGEYCGTNWQITSHYELIIGDGTEQTLAKEDETDQVLTAEDTPA